MFYFAAAIVLALLVYFVVRSRQSRALDQKVDGAVVITGANEINVQL